MKNVDRLFIGGCAVVLLSAVLARTVAQPASSPELPASPVPNAPEIVRLPVQSEAEAAQDAAQLAPDDAQPTTGQNQPAVGQNQTATVWKQPTTGGKQPTTDGARTATDDNRAAPARNQATAARNRTAAVRLQSAPVRAQAAPVRALKNASPSPAPVKPAAPLVRQDGDVNLRAEDGVYDEKRDVARLIKSVRVTQDGEDFLLTCEELLYNRNQNKAVATGNVRIATRDTTITGTRLQADFDRKVVTLTGNVEMRSHGKGDGLKSDSGPVSRSKPSRMTCDRVEYNYETRDAVVTGSIRMTQEDTVGTCLKILFDEENNIVTLQGNAKFSKAQSQTLQAPEIKVWLDSGVAKALKQTVIRFEPRNKTPVARPTKAAPEAVPQLPQELLDEFEARQTPTPASAPATEPTPTPTP